ncbi:DinB family protein [Actinomycetospora sp. TBRC 11914]|uniref:DinB family protein n=1 Tax=Actinomycetospora sp. TBRC 11914 TaxID=2729387 RepID=UPI00145FD158|nr:DinB family protein [Actinomycetospora sp. TBRC 11914]NMO91383.1 DinB family protein [Actinomycetospora sp. TBRC 11914]
MSTTERAVPPMSADERDTLAGWLDFYRDTVAAKCHGLDEEQLRTASVPPSPLTPLGLLQHLAEVERNWFRRVLLGEDVPPLYDSPSSTGEHSGGFDLTADVTGEQALATWQQEVERAVEACAGRDPGSRVPFGDGEVTLRWICVHMIGEYARHAGHADLLRERIDGATGV